MILDLEDFTELLSLGFKLRLKYGRHIFFSLQNLKCMKINNKYIEHLPKLFFGHVCVIIRFPI